MKCPYEHCGGEIDPAALRFKTGVGRVGKCPKCSRRITLTWRTKGEKRITNSQKRKRKRALCARQGKKK